MSCYNRCDCDNCCSCDRCHRYSRHHCDRDGENIFGGLIFLLIALVIGAALLDSAEERRERSLAPTTVEQIAEV